MFADYVSRIGAKGIDAEAILEYIRGQLP
jgi:hypothetical protein